MLIKGNQLLNLKVISLSDGKEIGKVKDIIFEPRENKLKAIMIDEGGWFGDAKVIVFEDIRAIGNDAVTVENLGVIRKALDVSDRVAKMAKGDNYLTKDKVVTENGDELGKVSDIIFDDQSGQVTQLEVSQGLGNLKSGVKKIDVSNIVTVGEDVLVVKEAAWDEINRQEEQKLQGTLYKGEQIKEKGRNIFEQVDEKVSQMGQDISEKLKQMDLPGKAQGAKDTLEDKRIINAVGKYVTVNILSPNDEMLAKRGDMITNDLINKAKNYGILDKVLSNTSDMPPA